MPPVKKKVNCSVMDLHLNARRGEHSYFLGKIRPNSVKKSETYGFLNWLLFTAGYCSSLQTALRVQARATYNN